MTIRVGRGWSEGKAFPYKLRQSRRPFGPRISFIDDSRFLNRHDFDKLFGAVEKFSIGLIEG